MVKKAAKAEINAFVRGLITEANPLNFPENASVDEVNFELNRDGSRSRRLGMDYESGFSFRSPPIAVPVSRDTPIQTFEWENAGSIPGKTILTVQILNSLDFYDLSVSPVSAEGYLGNILLTTTPSTDNKYSLASVDGRLVVVDGSGDISIVSFNGTGFTQETTRLRVRDTWGISYPDTDTDPTLNPTENSEVHIYNLYNQSWGLPRRNEGNAGVYLDPMTLYRTVYSKYPSDSEVVTTGLQLQPTSPPNIPSERLFVNLYKEQLGTKLKAAKGYFLIDLLRRGASRASEVARNADKHPEMELKSLTCPQDYTPNGANVVCEFAGRVFYSGFSGTVVDGDGRSPDLSNYIAFSMLVKNKNDIVKCYQEGDPTSREGNDLVDTDGGLIRISGADGILHMINIGTNLVVFARNGVWLVSGGSDYGFSATNYKVSRITKFGLLSPSSVIQETGKAFYWSTDGIYAILPTQVGDLTVENITESTIQTLYESISVENKSRAKGTYDLTGKKVRWVYTEDKPEQNTYVTTELIFDTVLKAFYKHEIKKFAYNSGPEVVGIFKSPPFSFASTLAEVTAGGVLVVADDEQVVAGTASEVEGVKSTRYLAVKFSGATATYTFANYSNTSFKDWQAENGTGVDAKAYLLTGAITAGDSSVAKQAPYLVMHFRRTETGLSGTYEPINPSSCFIRSQWDFTNSINSNKWGPLFQGYRYVRAFIPVTGTSGLDTGYELVTTKNKLRGRGRALSLYMETEVGKDCKIMGWSLALNGNAVT